MLNFLWIMSKCHLLIHLSVLFSVHASWGILGIVVEKSNSLFFPLAPYTNKNICYSTQCQCHTAHRFIEHIRTQIEPLVPCGCVFYIISLQLQFLKGGLIKRKYRDGEREMEFCIKQR